ncbi:MAG: thiamine pyrophosphate-binding protein [Acidobacteriota bacterium]
MRTTGAELVVRALEEEGARYTFGIPGTHNIELYDALDRSAAITPILVTDEQSASFMADGVARSTGGVGVVNVVPGAGVTHALSGIAEAFMDTVPLVVLTCGVRNDTGRAYQLHDIDQLALLRPVTKAAWRAEEPADCYALVRRAFALARAGSPGPVAVEIPANYYLLAHDIHAPSFPPADPVPPSPTPDAVREIVALLEEARRPALYIGLGSRGAADVLPALAEALDAPVCTTISGKGVFPEDHPLFLWNGFGRSAPRFVRDAMGRCDCLLAIGCRFGEVATASYGFEPPADLIHVDVNPEVLGRNYPARIDVVSDARAFVEALRPRLRSRSPDEGRRAAVAAGHRDVREEWARHPSADRVTPAVLLTTIQELAGDDAVYATDSGNGTFLAMEQLRLRAPGRFLAPVDYSCMGYSVPAAIGAKLADPGRDVIALTGDGALLMTGLELLTAAAYRAGVVVCVLRDGELAQIAQFQRTTLDRATCSELHPYSTEAFARAANCAFLAIGRDEEVRPVLGEALATARTGRPVVVEVAIDYSRKTYFTKGVVATNLWRLPWRDRLRVVGRAVARKLGA